MKKWLIVEIGVLVAFIGIGVLSTYYFAGVANRATYKRQTQELVVATFSALKRACCTNVIKLVIARQRQVLPKQSRWS